MDIKALLTKFVGHTRTNAPLLITAAAVTGVVATTVLAAKASHKSKHVSYEDAQEHAPGVERKEWIVAEVRETWKNYVPTIISGALTITSIVLIHKTHMKRYAALAGLYALGNQAFQEFREAAEEVLSTKDNDKVKVAASEKAVEREKKQLQALEFQDTEQTIILDMFSGRMFLSDIEAIRRAENDFNKDLINHSYGSLNHFYQLIGLDPTGIGEDVGWRADDGKLMSVGFNAVIHDGRPIMTIDFHDNPPTFEYYNTH